jgi:hypothetical protein
MQDVAPGMHGKLPCHFGTCRCVLACAGVTQCVDWTQNVCCRCLTTMVAALICHPSGKAVVTGSRPHLRGYSTTSTYVVHWILCLNITAQVGSVISRLVSGCQSWHWVAWFHVFLSKVLGRPRTSDFTRCDNHGSNCRSWRGAAH